MKWKLQNWKHRTEINISVERLNSRVKITEDRIRELEKKITESTQYEQKKMDSKRKVNRA